MLPRIFLRNHSKLANLPKNANEDALRIMIMKQKKDKGVVEEEDIALLTETLKLPIKPPSTGPESAKISRLDPAYLKTLGIKYNDLMTMRADEMMTRNEELRERLKTPTLHNLTELIHVNSITKRVTEAQKAFDHILELGLVPDLVAYNHLMNAYASVNDLENTKKIMNEIKNNSNFSGPDIVSYSTLIKCLSQNNIIEEAFNVLSIINHF